MEDDIIRRLQNACDSFRKSEIEGCQKTLRERLSEREWEIMQMLIDCGNAEIAEALHISEQAVKTYVEDIYRKLEIRERYRVAEAAGSLLSQKRTEEQRDFN